MNQPIAMTWAKTRQAPLWVSVALFAAAAADPTTGILHLKRGELAKAMREDSSTRMVWEAVQRAVQAGWLAPESTTTCLILERKANR